MANDLSNAAGWWGINRCPRAVIVVSGDSPADALAATALSDPTGNSSEPYLRRTAAADPLFDPVGAYKRVDTDYAPVIVTSAARRGATKLSAASRFAVQDLRNGGCTSAREAIIVGGVSAVPVAVEEELLGMGFDSVFRVAGSNRFGTAAAVAQALGTASAVTGVTGCNDGSSTDGSTRMTFYNNSVVEWRPSGTDCRLLNRTVVLADGLTGADAIAAGWWTSFWQVPVLLHNGTDVLPFETAEALETLNISNLVILGGEARISEAVAQEAAELSGATTWRVAGRDRYETSIKMAERLGGWWGSTSSMDTSSSMLCFAGSSGSGRGSRGWADALGAGAWCAAASGAAANRTPPARRLGPTYGASPFDAVPPERLSRDAVPVILVRAGSDQLPSSVADFLARNFDPNQYWCSSVSASAGCAVPGFSVLFGGTSIISDAIANQISSAVGGSVEGVGVQTKPDIAGVFGTKMSLSPVFRELGSGYLQMCSNRGGYSDARWLLMGVGQQSVPLTTVDIMAQSWYLRDGDGMARLPGLGAPGCVKGSFGGEEKLWIKAVGLDGLTSNSVAVGSDSAKYLGLSDFITARPAYETSGIDSSSDPNTGGTSLWRFRAYAPPILVSSNQEEISAVDSEISITLNRGNSIDGLAPDSFAASWILELANGSISGTAEGEALYIDGVWKLRGFSDLSAGSATDLRGRGGFKADITVLEPGLGDDFLEWQFDTYSW
ncbi:MAG: hypothetical protein CMB31_06065 [Euryarchaeota archaeon]|nr:hypothetical protein [Euryarchaeota archaeon]